MMNARLAGRLERYHGAKALQKKRAEKSAKTYVRKVARDLTVCFKGHTYDVSDVPGAEVGKELQLVIFAFEYPKAVSIWQPGAPIVFHAAPLVVRDASARFRADAPIIGADAKEWRRP